jgi:signal transduction histidine kinase
LLHTFLKHLRTGIVLCNALGKITLVNSAARQLAQTDPVGQLLNTASSVWGEMYGVDGRNIPAGEWPWMRALRGEITLGSEYRLVRRNGDYRDVLFGAFPIQWRRSQISGVLGSLTNVTEHNNKHVVLRNEAILNERARVAGEIHDTLAQGLNAVVLQLEAADKEFSSSVEQGRLRLRRLRELARANLAEARRSIWLLSSGSFGNEDPAGALAFLAKRLFEDLPIELGLHMQKAIPGLAPEVRHELLRIGQEALTNILRHAHASRVRIELVSSDRQVRLSVADNGRGFTVAAIPNARQGFGLLSLRMRAERVGGKLAIQSRIGRGTRIVATVPASP